MNITFEPVAGLLKKTEIENVEQEKQEYKLIGTFLRTPGMRLYYYNSLKDELGELIIERGRSIHILPRDGKLTPVDLELEKVMVDSRFDFFEKTNMRNAIKWVEKYKRGEIKELCNLLKPGGGIKFW